MSSVADQPLKLPASSLPAAQRYLTGSLDAIRRKGNRAFRAGAVVKIAERPDLSGYVASVLGKRLFQATLSFRDAAWSGECSCGEEFDCYHCYAGMLAALPLLRVLLQHAPADEGDEAGQAPGPRLAKSFLEEARRRSPRALTAAETKSAEAVDRLFTHHRSSRCVAASSLYPIFGNVGTWGWQMFEIWPREPENPWEAWLFLANMANREGLKIPAWVKAITPEKDVRDFVGQLERQESIHRWQEMLRLRVNSIERRRTDPMEIRAVIDRAEIRLENRFSASEPFKPLKNPAFREIVHGFGRGVTGIALAARPLLLAFSQHEPLRAAVPHQDAVASEILNHLLRTPGVRDLVVNGDGQPFTYSGERLAWRIEEADSEAADYRLSLALPDGTAPPRFVAAADGDPSLYISADCIFEAPPLHGFQPNPAKPNTVPAPALETEAGVSILNSLGLPLPARLRKRVLDLPVRVTFACKLRKQNNYALSESLAITVEADIGKEGGAFRLAPGGWQPIRNRSAPANVIVRVDETIQENAARLVRDFKLSWNPFNHEWEKEIGKKFPPQFADWIARMPPEIAVKLDPMLQTLQEEPISASVKLDVEEAGLDWFDLRVALDVADTTLTQEELKALLDARGQFVRIDGKGWRRMKLDITDEDDARLADLGLRAGDFSSEPQRLHTLQLAGKSASALLPEERVESIRRRVTELQARVTPPVPAAIRAELRPYQVEGFHFLAYLAANHFGGILADDMGLGKTVQALAWLEWLREQSETEARNSLVVCPKSVMENWHGEAERFLPSLRVRLWRGADLDDLKEIAKETDLLVVNYTQLRLAASVLASMQWRAVILDEGQCIKNPQSQTARAACALRADYRLVLSGTPIENRLLDLWSLMRFAMPGMLGKRSDFARTYDHPADALGRRRLAARVRPFVLRRTKGEVAKDLPARVEEDILCDLEGEQATLYRAEIKRARQHLLKLRTAGELEGQRFNFLTSLLRLRQICCHPGLIGADAAKAGSAKLSALVELLEPLMEEGQKVLVFSQFVGVLDLIEQEIATREWRTFKLIGATEDRGVLVSEFQKAEGAAVFLISLKAGGFGLNLTAASYVVLFDPWWNPAVENQAIDRTHRIGQANTVFAYRLLMKDSIEEKVRELQRRKGALAIDILGEESFARQLTLEDFQFLLSGD